MKAKGLSVVMIAVVFGWLFAGQGFAEDAQLDSMSLDMSDVTADPVARTLDFGPEWKKITDGVWESVDKNGLRSRRIFGLSGLQWKLAQDRVELVNMLDKNAMVTSGLEEDALHLLARIRELEIIEQDLLVTAKTGDDDSGYMCGSNWYVRAACDAGFGTHYGVIGNATFEGSPTCSVSCSTSAKIWADTVPAGVSDRDTDYSSPNGGDGSCWAEARLQESVVGEWVHTEAYSAVRYFSGSTWIGFFSVDCYQ